MFVLLLRDPRTPVQVPPSLWQRRSSSCWWWSTSWAVSGSSSWEPTQSRGTWRLCCWRSSSSRWSWLDSSRNRYRRRPSHSGEHANTYTLVCLWLAFPKPFPSLYFNSTRRLGKAVRCSFQTDLCSRDFMPGCFYENSLWDHVISESLISGWLFLFWTLCYEMVLPVNTQSMNP